MRALQMPELREEQQIELAEIYRKTKDVRIRTRAQMVLLACEQRPSAPVIAAIVREDDETVRRWLKRYIVQGIEGLRSIIILAKQWFNSNRISGARRLLNCFLHWWRNIQRKRSTWPGTMPIPMKMRKWMQSCKLRNCVASTFPPRAFTQSGSLPQSCFGAGSLPHRYDFRSIDRLLSDQARLGTRSVASAQPLVAAHFDAYHVLFLHFNQQDVAPSLQFDRPVA